MAADDSDVDYNPDESQDSENDEWTDYEVTEEKDNDQNKKEETESETETERKRDTIRREPSRRLMALAAADPLYNWDDSFYSHQKLTSRPVAVPNCVQFDLVTYRPPTITTEPSDLQAFEVFCRTNRSKWHKNHWYRQLHGRMYQVSNCGHDSPNNLQNHRLYRAIMAGVLTIRDMDPTDPKHGVQCQVCNIVERTSTFRVEIRTTENKITSICAGQYCAKRLEALKELWEVLNHLKYYIDRRDIVLALKHVGGCESACAKALKAYKRH
jgi:hypothetical protein